MREKGSKSSLSQEYHHAALPSDTIISVVFALPTAATKEKLVLSQSRPPLTACARFGRVGPRPLPHPPQKTKKNIGAFARFQCCLANQGAVLFVGVGGEAE